MQCYRRSLLPPVGRLGVSTPPPHPPLNAAYFTADCFIQIGVRLTSRQLQKDQASLDKMPREALPLDPHREHGEGGVSVAQAR